LSTLKLIAQFIDMLKLTDLQKSEKENFLVKLSKLIEPILNLVSHPSQLISEMARQVN
jgi:hypothetical protein